MANTYILQSFFIPHLPSNHITHTTSTFPVSNTLPPPNILFTGYLCKSYYRDTPEYMTYTENHNVNVFKRANTLPDHYHLLKNRQSLVINNDRNLTQNIIHANIIKFHKAINTTGQLNRDIIASPRSFINHRATRDSHHQFRHTLTAREQLI